MTLQTAALQETAALLANIEPLLFTEIRQAEHHELPTIKISLARAKEIHRMAIILEKRIKNILVTAADQTTTTDRHLDAIFNINQ